MDQITTFFALYGWELAIIAFIGVALLGILKYANVFSNIEKEKRKPIYFAISIGFSITATMVYLAVIDQFEINHLIAISTAIYALNQAMYSIYETTPLRDLLVKIFSGLSEIIKKK